MLNAPSLSSDSAAAVRSARVIERSADALGRLRLVLRLNAASSAVAGLSMATAPGTIDDLLGTGHPGWVRVAGLALVAFAAFVAWFSTTGPEVVRRFTPDIIAADIGWVVASIVTVAVGWYSGSGNVAVIALAVMVDVWAFLQWRSWRQLRPTR